MPFLPIPSARVSVEDASLWKLGFDVMEVKDADFGKFDAALTRFAAKEEGADIALFYFAGHGFALAGGDLRPRNYLMTTSADMRATSDAVLRRDGLSIDEVIKRISAPAKVTLAFIDACRNDPFHRGAGDRGFEHEPLLIVLRALREQIVVLHRRLLAIVRDDEVCRRLMTTPGVGPVVALTYRATVDVPARFRKSKAVGAVFGLTCSKYQSGEIDRSGKISRCGDEMMRVMLYEAAQSMLRTKKWSWLKAWAMQIARRRGIKKAIVALARRLAVIMHRIWVDGTEFRWTREQAAAAA